MRPVSLAVAGLFVAILLACSGIQPPVTSDNTTTDGTTPDVTTPDPVVEAAPEEAGDALPEPWAGMLLPIGDGEVVEVTTDHILVAYPTASLLTLTNTWTGAMTNGGYTQVEDVSQPGITGLIFKKGAQIMGLATGQEEGVNFAYVEDLGKVERSMVRGQRKLGGLKGKSGKPGMRRPGMGPGMGPGQHRSSGGN